MLDPLNTRIHDTDTLTIDVDGPGCSGPSNQASISLDIDDDRVLGRARTPIPSWVIVRPH